MSDEPSDLADHLLQGLQGLVLQIDAISSDLPAGEPSREALEHWLASADRLIHQGTAPEAADGPLAWVSVLLGRVTLDRQQPHRALPLRLRMQVGRVPWPLRSGVQQAVGRLACDQVRRSCLEARATAVNVQMHGDPEGLMLRVRDNGHWPRPLPMRGQREIEQTTPALRRGCARLGARLRLWRWPGGGSELQLQLPAQRAFSMASGPAAHEA